MPEPNDALYFTDNRAGHELLTYSDDIVFPAGFTLADVEKLAVSAACVAAWRPAIDLVAPEIGGALMAIDRVKDALAPFADLLKENKDG